MSPEPCPVSSPRPATVEGAGELFRRCLGAPTRPGAPIRQRAWNELISRYERRLRSTLRSSFGPRRTEADVEDCLQDLYLRLLRLDPAAFRGRSDRELEHYLERMARNLAIDRQRRTRSERRRLRGALVRESGFDGATRAPDQERRVIARQRLDGYWRRCRRLLEETVQRETPVDLRFRAVRLALFEGCGSQEIARRLDGRVSAAQVDSMVYRLRRRLARDGVAVRRRGRATVPAATLSTTPATTPAAAGALTPLSIDR